MLTAKPTGDVAPLRGCFYPEELHFAEPTHAAAKAITECAIKSKMQLAVFTAHQRALLSEKPESTVAKVIRDAVTSKAYLKLGGINHWASARSAELMAEAAAAAAASAAAAADAGAGVEKAGARGERRLKRVNSLQAYRAREDFNAKDGQWNGQ